MAGTATRAVFGATLLAAGIALTAVGAMAMRSPAGSLDASPPGEAAEAAEAMAVPAAEIARLGEALREHLPPDATVLAWPDVSRELHLPRSAPAASFDWADSLLAPRDEGIRQLREHAGGRTLHLVVHVRDALLLGDMAPGRFGVAIRDRADSGNLHGSINSARDWVRTEGFVAYSAYRLDDSRLRLVALTDEASMSTLLAQLLPFHDPRRPREPVAGLTLVHQVGGFWVYRLDPGHG